MDLLIPGELWTIHLPLLAASLKGSILFRYPRQGPVHRPDTVIGGFQGGLLGPSADNSPLDYSSLGTWVFSLILAGATANLVSGVLHLHPLPALIL